MTIQGLIGVRCNHLYTQYSLSNYNNGTLHTSVQYKLIQSKIHSNSHNFEYYNLPHLNFLRHSHVLL